MKRLSQTTRTDRCSWQSNDTADGDCSWLCGVKTIHHQKPLNVLFRGRRLLASLLSEVRTWQWCSTSYFRRRSGCSLLDRAKNKCRVSSDRCVDTASVMRWKLKRLWEMTFLVVSRKKGWDLLCSRRLILKKSQIFCWKESDICWEESDI